MQCLLLHAENGCKRLKREFSPFLDPKRAHECSFAVLGAKSLKREFSHFLGPKRAQECSFTVLGSKTCSRVEFRCFGVQRVLNRSVSLFWAPNTAFCKFGTARHFGPCFICF